jgi:hypothetical protein
MSAAGESVHVVAVDPEQGPETIVLDLVNPAITLRWLGR